MTCYVLDVVRQTASKFSYVVSLEGSALYVFVSDDPFDALQKILTFCYFRTYRDMCLNDFLTNQTRDKINYVSIFSRVESRQAMNFYV